MPNPAGHNHSGKGQPDEAPDPRKEGAMADGITGNTAAPQPGSTTPAGQPAQQPQTNTASAIDPADYARLQRISQQFEGQKGLIEKARNYGFDKPEVFDQWGPTFQNLTKAGVNPQRFAEAFQQSKEENPDATAGATIKDVEALIGQKLSAEKKAWIREQAEKEHSASTRGEMESFTTKDINDIVGADAPEVLKEMLSEAFHGAYFKNRQPYPEDHPLAGSFAPAGSEGLGKIRTQMTGWIEKLRAHEWKSIGDDARKTPSTLGTQQGGKAPAKPTKDVRETPKEKTRRFIGEAASKIGA